MDRRCAAGALLALAACIATTAAAPTASNQTALDLYEGPSEGCYYNFQHYGEGDRIMTNEPCLNCTCHNRMLMCYLRVCPFTKPIGQDCSVEKRADQCCPIVTCPDVPVDLLTSTSTSSPSEYGETGLGKLDRYGCSINGKYFPEGSKVPPSPNKPCEHCYCIRNMTTCVMQECTLHVDGCTPIYRKDVCCPVRYSCDHPEDEIPLLDDMTTTVRPTPGFLLTTTTLAPVTQISQDCVHDDKIFADGALIKTEKACEHCYCMKGDIVCVVQECGTPMENEGKNCTSMPPREGQCCPDTYICEGDEVTTEPKPDTATVTPFEDISTLSPPRRVSVEGSGYRSETDEPSTEITPLEPDTEGSGEEQPFKPMDANDMLIPERATSHPLIVTDQDEIPDNFSPSTTEIPESEAKITEKITTEADKGENTVPSGDFEEDSSDKPASAVETTTTKLETEKESSYDAKTTVLPEHETFVKDKTTLHEEMAATEPTIIEESTIADHGLHTSPEDQGTETTVPARRHEDEEVMPKETTTLKHLEEATTQSSGIIAIDTVATESTTSSFIEQEIKTTISQLTEKDKEVKESTTESHVYLTTEFDVNKADTQSATTLQPETATELTTPSKGDIADTTSVNPIENEIDEESFLTLAPGRIPGEGDCLIDGVTYSHESIVPSSSNCHTSCKCISSIVKCEPIVCSPAPDYMDNCQPMYDSPESCCPTYVCDHPRETVPPQSHSQMAGTESPIPTPTIECDGDQCQIVKEKQEPSIPCTSGGCADNSNKKPDECGPQGCDEAVSIPEKARQPTEGCIGDSCSSSPEQCTSGKCEAAIPKDQTCNNENGCEIAVVQPCQGDDCAIQPDVTATKVDAATCDSPSGCDIPVVQTCQGDDCSNQPDITSSKDSSTHCDDPDGCKNAPIPETAPHCTGESCISELPPKTAQDSQDCKNGNDCGQSIQTTSIEECNEEECKSQHVPEISKPSYDGDCIGTMCTQQEDHIPQVTDVPQLATESGMSETESNGESQTKSEEPVTDLPKTTGIEKEIEPGATTKASISDKEEESRTTPKYDEIDKIKEKVIPSIISESPEPVTEATEGPQDNSITDSSKTDTTLAPSQDGTQVKEPLSEVTAAEVATTGIPEETESPESPIKPIGDGHSGVPEDDAKDKNTFEITTTQAAIYSSSPKMTEEITEPPEILTLAPETLDRDGHEKPTKEPEYVQDTEVKVTESTERYTSVPEHITDKGDIEPIREQEQESAPTTPKSYETQTVVAETQTILPQDEEQAPISTSIPEEPKTGKPDDIKQTAIDMTTPASAEKAETDAPQFVSEYTTSKPEMQLDIESETQQPELNVTPGVESITKAPVSDITGETESQTEEPKPLVTSPHEPSIVDSDVDQNAETPPPVIVNVQTQTPMSIVKDHSDGEVESVATPEPEITTESITPESESLKPTAIPDKTQSKEPVSDIEKMPSVSDVEYTVLTTEPSPDRLGTSSVAIDVLPTKQDVDDSDKTHIPEIETSTDSLPVSVPIVYEPISSESPVTEANLDEASASQEKTSEETKLPTSVTESSVQPTTEEGEIATSAKTQSDDKEDVTELPELIVHEHPTEPSSIEQEPEQPANEEIVTKEPQEFVPEKETSDAPTPQDSITVAIDTPESISEKEATGEPGQESATEAPQFSQSETTKPKPDDEISQIPESYTTESQKEITEGLGLQVTTNTPEPTATDAHKEDIDTPEIQATTSSTLKVSEIAPQAAITESQPTVTETDVLVTQPHKDTTDSPISSDMVTDLSEPSDTTSAPHKESPTLPEKPEIIPYTETIKTQDITTTVPEVSPTELHKESTESPGLQDTVTKAAEIPTDTSDKETTEEYKPQDSVTIAPEVSSAEPQKETTTVPEGTGMAASEPDTPDIVHTEQTTEAPVEKDVITSTPELIITEAVPLENTNIPTIEEKVTTLPEISVTEYPPIPQDSSSGVPELYATESQKEVTEEASAAEDTVTNVPEIVITEPHKDSQEPESQDTATILPEFAGTDAKKDTNPPESQETSSTIPETLETEPKKEITEAPELQGVTDTPEMSANTKAPEKHEGATGAQDMATNAPEGSTVLDDELTEIPTSSEKTVTEPDNEPTESTEPIITESQKPATELPKISPAEVTSPPEQLATKSDKEITETPQQELTTKVSDQEPEKDESVTEPPSKITTKLDDYTDSEPQEFVTPTAPPKIGSELSLTTEVGSPIAPSTKVTESLATEYPIKITDSDADTESPAPSVTPAEGKPHEEQEIKTEIPYVQPAQTELPVTGSIEPDTKAPEVIDTESGTTATPELTETEKPDLKLTQPTTAATEEDVTKAPEIVESQDKTTKISEEPERTTNDVYPETTPESVLLEEHTHKTISPDEETSVSPSDIPIKEYETSTPEVSKDRTTESTPSTESEKSPQEDVVSDKDHYVPEVTQTTTPEKSTKPSPVSDEITTSSPSLVSLETEQPQIVESNEISTSAPTISEESSETEKPLVTSVESETDKELVSSDKPQQTIVPEDEFMIATTKATTIKADEEPTTLPPLLDKFGKPDEEEAQKPAAEPEKPKPDVTEEISKPGANEVQPTEEAPEEEGHFPPSGTSGYGQEPDYGEEDSFGPGTCRYGGKVYVSAQQIPRDDPCDFCFCFRSDIICLQQSCPPPIHGCHEEPIQGFCCPRYECPVSMATTLNVTTTTTTTTTTLPPHFLPHAYKGAAQRRGCQIKGHTYKVGEVVRASSGPCLHCTCGGDGQMKCDPKVCTPEPMLRQMIAAAVSAKRRR